MTTSWVPEIDAPAVPSSCWLCLYTIPELLVGMTFIFLVISAFHMSRAKRFQLISSEFSNSSKTFSMGKIARDAGIVTVV